jgi:Flp pilus assembly protein CpaB
MNNIIIAIKRFLQNKNTVTLIGIILVLVIIFIMYNTTVQRTVQPISVATASRKINPGEQITADMVVMKKVPRSGISDNVLKAQAAVVGKYVNYDATIPMGSMFYSEVVVKKEDLPDSTFTQVKEGDVVFEMTVNTKTTYGNAIRPGNKIDVYVKVNDDNGLIMIAKFLENIEVLAVKDSDGRNVFGGEEGKVPAQMIFGLKPEVYILLEKTKRLTRYGAEIIIVPQGGVAPEESKDPTITSETIKAFINSKTVVLEEEPVVNTPTVEEQATEGE